VSDYPTVDSPDPAAEPLLAALLEQLQTRHHGAVCAVLVYGSCLRSGDIYDGLLDLYLVLDAYRSAYRGQPLLAMGNWILPPNVFYAEVRSRQQVLRSKVTVISLTDFRRGCSPSWFASYLWGRFAQPVGVLYSRDPASRRAVEEALLQAADTLLRRTLPALPAQGPVAALWEQALALSYATELRTERRGRAGELVAAAPDFYRQLTAIVAANPDPPLALEGGVGGVFYRTAFSAGRRRLCRWTWALRRVQGKLLSVLRLVKALFTFEGGLDYIAWKLERHSGERIVIPPRVRRAPLLFVWGFFWDLYRRGIFR
jgi:hypothetical protein